MPDSGGFIQRWSKRKAEAAEPALAAEPREDNPPEPALPDAAQEPPPPLPSLDDVVPGRDVAAFFGRHVPEELRNAALRKAWTSDPAISGFIEMAENQWDFNSPGGALAAGFGAIPAGFDVEKVARAIMGEKPGPARADAAPELADSAENSAAVQQAEPAALLDAPGHALPESVQPEHAARIENAPDDVAPQQALPVQTPSNRRHGGALPRA